MGAGSERSGRASQPLAGLSAALCISWATILYDYPLLRWPCLIDQQAHKGWEMVGRTMWSLKLPSVCTNGWARTIAPLTYFLFC